MIRNLVSWWLLLTNRDPDSFVFFQAHFWADLSPNTCFFCHYQKQPWSRYLMDLEYEAVISGLHVWNPDIASFEFTHDVPIMIAEADKR